MAKTKRGVVKKNKSKKKYKRATTRVEKTKKSRNEIAKANRLRKLKQTDVGWTYVTETDLSAPLPLDTIPLGQNHDQREGVSAKIHKVEISFHVRAAQYYGTLNNADPPSDLTLARNRLNERAGCGIDYIAVLDKCPNQNPPEPAGAVFEQAGNNKLWKARIKWEKQTRYKILKQGFVGVNPEDFDFIPLDGDRFFVPKVSTEKVVRFKVNKVTHYIGSGGEDGTQDKNAIRLYMRWRTNDATSLALIPDPWSMSIRATTWFTDP